MDLPYEVLFTWHGIAKFLQFLCLAGVVAGLRLAVAAPEGEGEDETQFIATLRRHGAGHALAATMGLPIITGFYMVQAPWSAKSGGFFNVWLVPFSPSDRIVQASVAAKAFSVSQKRQRRLHPVNRTNRCLSPA